MKPISTKSIPSKSFLILTSVLALTLALLSLGAPALALAQAQTKENGLQDIAQGLDDFSPYVPEKPLGALVSDTVSSATPVKPMSTNPIVPASAMPTLAAPTTPSSPSIPADWQRHSFAELSFAAPAGWKTLQDDEDVLMLGDIDKKTRTGMTVSIQFERNDPRKDTPPGMKKSDLAPVMIGNQSFAHLMFKGKMGDVPASIHMLVADTKTKKVRYLVITALAANMQPKDFEKPLAQVLASLQPAAISALGLAETQTAEIGFVTFTLPAGWKVLQDKKDALSIQLANSYAAYLMVETGIYAKDSASRVTGPGKSTTILGQPATLYMGKTEITVIHNGVGSIAKAITRTYILTSCTADGMPIVVEETATPAWLKSTGFVTLEKSIQMSLPKGAKACTLISQNSQEQITPHEESTDKYNRSKLHEAVSQGDLEKIKYLLNSGEDPNIKDKLGRTPLHYSASTGNLDVAKLLLEKGSSINSLDTSKHWTPLFFAYFMGRVEMAEYLLANGADATIKDKSGKLAFEYKK